MVAAAAGVAPAAAAAAAAAAVAVAAVAAASAVVAVAVARLNFDWIVVAHHPLDGHPCPHAHALFVGWHLHRCRPERSPT